MVLDVLASGRGLGQTWQKGQMAFMALGMAASAYALLAVPVGTFLDTRVAMQVCSVIYAIFGLQMLVVPAFFLSENFEGHPTQGQAALFLHFVMRMFGLLILAVSAVLFLLPKAGDQPVLFKIFAAYNCVQIFMGPGKAIQLFDTTAKHIVPVVLLPTVGFILAAPMF